MAGFNFLLAFASGVMHSHAMNNNDSLPNIFTYRIWIRTDHSEGTLTYEDVAATSAANATRAVIKWLRSNGYVVSSKITKEWDGEVTAVIERIENQTVMDRRARTLR